MKRLSFIVLSTILLLPGMALAQTADLSSLTQGGLSMTASPQYPQPGQNVIFSLQDYQDDLSVSTITWSAGGVKQASGVGQTTFQMSAGAAGVRENITATVVTQGGKVLSQSVAIVPESVDLLWQAHSYVPPFYKGKALFPFQGDITVTAMPSFALTNPKNAVYSWSLDGTVNPDISGSGKNVITLTGSILLKPINLSVTVTSGDNSLTAANSITLTGTNPAIVLYQESPLYGLLLNTAIGANLSLSGQTGINAAPYFFDSTAPFTNTATFGWQINGAAVSGQTSQVLVVAPPGNQSGTSTVAVTASNAAKSFQSASGAVNIGFTAAQ